jgi:hypothetical protein
MITNQLAPVQARMVASGRTRHLSHVLMQARPGLKRTVFDPSKQADRLQYARFMAEGKWVDGKSFVCEAPYPSVPQAVERKLLEFFLKPELAKINQPIAPAPSVVPIRKRA